jgi:hypothetical protein
MLPDKYAQNGRFTLKTILLRGAVIFVVINRYFWPSYRFL